VRATESTEKEKKHFVALRAGRQFIIARSAHNFSVYSVVLTFISVLNCFLKSPSRRTAAHSSGLADFQDANEGTDRCRPNRKR
jgi:hypothetical protein